MTAAAIRHSSGGSRSSWAIAPYPPGEEPDGWIATFSDPDDNYFQLVSPM
jgi:predicted enzyme related to lactoylglutathione lyase